MRLLAIPVLVSVGLGCTVRNPRYCDETTPCNDPDHPEQTYCDVDGLYNADGVKNRCVENPFDAGPTCESSQECTVETSPICDEDDGMCRPCDVDGNGNTECAAKDSANPYCDGDGSCVSGCSSSDGCPADAPICSDSHRCVPCDWDGSGDADCANRDAATPRCKPADGTCVACVSDVDCGGTTPVCDDETDACRACVENEECDSEICDRESGACVAKENIVYVDQVLGTDGDTCGTKDDACAKIMGAQGGLAKVTETRNTVLVRGGTYVESVAVGDGQTVVLIGNGATIAPPLDHPGLLVSNGSNVTAETITLADATGNSEADGVRCSGSTSSVTLYRVSVTDNKGIGVESADCPVHLERCLIAGNQGGGVSLSNLGFTLVNNIIANNGSAGVTDFGGVKIANSGSYSPQIFSFNTVARNKASEFADSSGVDCFASSMTATNSIVYTGFGAVAATHGSCSWTYSDVEGIAQSNGNIDATPDFHDAVGGDFHLEPGSPCQDKADPAATVDVDYDGQARPQPAGGRSDMGADEVMPE